MIGKRRWAVVGLVVLLVLLFVVAAFQASDPRYHGRTLTSWLQQYWDTWDTSLTETQRVAEVQDAVRGIGAKKAVPKLLRMVEAEDDPVSSWIIDAGDKLRISDKIGRRFIRWHSAEDFWWLGERGFEILGTNAAPAAEELGKLLNKRGHRRPLVIERCLESIGKPAEPVICRVLTNRDVAIRQWAIDELASVTDDVGVYIARITPRLHDSSDSVRGTTVDALGAQTIAPDLAVPLLVEALNDSSASANAANALANFGTNALVAFPLLTNLVENENEGAASAALRTLVIIAPIESLPILTNCIARRKPATDGALKALAEVASDKALPIVLNYFQSSDAKQRQVAFRLLCKFSMTPKIETAMQAAAADSDSVIASRAKEILTERYEKEHPLESQFLDDPIFEGRPLGQWLKMHDLQGFLSTEATNAVQRIGTNAIPALLKRLVYAQPPFGLPTQGAGIAHMDAVSGFIALGDQAVPAFPKFQELLDGTNQNTILYAMVCSLGTGSNAIPILVKGLTNQIAGVRGEAAHNLAEGVAARFPECRKEIIPLLVKLLNDPDPDVRRNVKGDLQEIDPTNIAKAGIK